MQKKKERLVLSKNDYAILLSYIKTGLPTFSRQDAEELEAELKTVTIVGREELPEDVVNLNATVVIKEEKEKRIMELMVVVPEKADIRKRRISVMSPLGTALIGFRKGQKVKWKVPGGNKTFTIMEVRQQEVLQSAG